MLPSVGIACTEAARKKATMAKMLLNCMIAERFERLEGASGREYVDGEKRS